MLNGTSAKRLPPPPVRDAGGWRAELGLPFRVPTPRSLAGAPSKWPVVDAIVGVGVLTAVFIVENLGKMPEGLAEFLAFRLSVKNLLLLTLFGLAWPGVLALCGLYRPPRLRRGTGEWKPLLVAATIGSVLMMVFPLTSRSGAVRPRDSLLFGIVVFPVTALLRGAVRGLERSSLGAWQQHVVLVGSGPLTMRMYEELRFDPLQTSEVVGFVDSRPQTALTMRGVPHLGTIEDLERILMYRVVDAVLIGLPIKSCYEEIQQVIAACERVGVSAKYPTDLFRTTLGVAYVEQAGATPVLSLPAHPNDYRLIIKRLMDVAGAAALLVLFAPVMAAILGMLKVTTPGPAFFAQERYGHLKRRFRMYKFRTMVVGAEGLQPQLEDRNEVTGPVFKIHDDPRITKVGRFLRRSSLDELPQLWNVLVGDMSLVGPRPLPIRDVGRFAEPRLMRRFSVRPGLTCLWQISGRSKLTFDEWIALDLQYIDRWSLWLDIWIMLLTPGAVLKGRGAA